MALLIGRNEFEIDRLKELIRVAEGVEGKVVKQRMEGWRRQLARKLEAQARFQKLISEAHSKRDQQQRS